MKYSVYMIMTSRDQARQVDCPNCSAKAGEKCLGVRGKIRESCHLERHQFAEVSANEH